MQRIAISFSTNMPRIAIIPASQLLGGGEYVNQIFYHEIGDLGALSQSGGLNLVMWLVIVT